MQNAWCLRKVALLGALAIAAAAVALPLKAAVSVTVSSESPPWQWDATLNADFVFGTGFIAGPTIVDASVLPFTPGDLLSVQVLSGVTSAYPPDYPLVDANGDLVQAGDDPNAYIGPVNDAPGDSGNGFPSQYMGADWPVNLMQLVGTFADDSGAIVGSPFAIGLGRSGPVPVGATRLQLGLNDDVFGDNGGSLLVSVAVVPEPGSALMLVAGLVLLLALKRATASAARKPEGISSPF